MQKMLNKEQVLKNSYMIILHNKNVLHFRNNDEIQKLIGIYRTNSNIHVLDIITNRNLLEYRNFDEQLMLLSLYIKNPSYEVFKNIVNCELIRNCSICDQINLINRCDTPKLKEEPKEKEVKKKRLFMWKARHN